MRQNGTKWTFEPIHADEDDETIIALSMDKATAGANAVALVWPDTNVNPLLCDMHAGARFVCNNRLDFNNFKDNKTIMQTDIHHHLKNLAHENFVATAKLKMVQKWESVLKEPAVARKWCDSWRNDSLTRVKSNRQETSPLRGGVPADNNAVESGNNADKQAMERRKHPLFAFVEEMAQRTVQDDSILRPIVPDDDGPVDTAIRHYVKWLTRICKFPMASEDDIIAMGDKGLVSCTCEDYLHCVFCKHSFLTGKKREMFLGYPPTLDPSPTSSNARTGRPTRIRGGEALNRNG